MRGWGLAILWGITALGAYSIGRQSPPVTNAPVAAVSLPVAAMPVAVPTHAARPTAVPTSSSTNGPPPAIKVSLPENAAPDVPGNPAPPDAKRKVEGALTAAAIIVPASRAQYHAGGRPCACPDDTMRNGRACGSRSAYSRPGGAAPLCYPTDVTPAMIESYRQRQALR
jgi:hypothetical protein